MPGFHADFVMRALTFDSVMLRSEVEQYALFSDADDSAEAEYRYNNEPESLVTQWLLGNQMDADMRLTREELRIGSSYRFYPEVKYPIVTDGGIPGDIDLLAIDNIQPHLSIGIQIKRFKAQILSDGKAQINWRTMKKGVLQANNMLDKYGFHRNYLMMLIVADTHLHKQELQMLRNLPYESKLSIYNHECLKELNEAIGIYTYEISQPSSNSVSSTGTIAVKELRPAAVLFQPTRTTETIEEYLKMREADIILPPSSADNF